MSAQTRPEAMRIVAVLPARFQSTRFEGKPLADLHGKPMIWWVYQRVMASARIDEVYVATDDQRIADACSTLGMNYVMTSSAHPTSTDRVHEVASRIPADLYVCVNGDEPLISAATVEAIIPAQAEGALAINLCSRIEAAPEVIDPTNIKVARSSSGRAIFMSRAPIPYPKGSLAFAYFKHVGVLAYTRAALDAFVSCPRGPVEQVEDINELRFIENDIPLQMIEVAGSRTLSVDTPKDLEAVRGVIAASEDPAIVGLRDC